MEESCSQMGLPVKLFLTVAKKLIQHLETHIHTFTWKISRRSPYSSSKREGSRGLSRARRWKISTILEEEEGQQSILSSAIRQRC